MTGAVLGVTSDGGWTAVLTIAGASVAAFCFAVAGAEAAVVLEPASAGGWTAVLKMAGAAAPACSCAVKC